MKLMEMLTNLYETTKVEAEDGRFKEFLNSLEVSDYEKLMEFGKELVELAEYQLSKRV